MSANKNKRTKLFEDNYHLLQKACVENGVELKEFNTRSYRLKKNGYALVDYYPTSEKVFMHQTKTWDHIYHIDVFIETYFNNTQ